jgi:hypothetical protein
VKEIDISSGFMLIFINSKGEKIGFPKIDGICTSKASPVTGLGDL